MFPILLIILQALACVEALWSSHWVKALYWACGCGITLAVKMMPER